MLAELRVIRAGLLVAALPRMRLASYLALAACVGLGGYLVSDTEDTSPAQPAARSPRIAALPAIAVPPSLPADDTLAPTVEDVDPIDVDEAMRGHASITDPAEFAMVFAVDGTSYLRLSAEERASVRGAARLVEHDGVFSVVAPVTTDAMPADLRAWAGRSVLVDGTCRARVVGFAEVSRVSGDAGPSWDYEEDKPVEAPAWTIESVSESNVTLAAKLDGCTGTWARAESYSPAAVAAKLDEPALESAAIADLLAKTEDDALQANWQEMGGEGDWRDAAEVVSQVYQHPLTNERWVFVQAWKSGGCGDASFSMMAAYRAREDGTVHRVADLDFGDEDLEQVVDLDGDGQPELILGGGDNRSVLVDLANTRHESIDVPYHAQHDCGC